MGLDDTTDFAWPGATAVSAEGARVGFTSCPSCGAAVLLDPRDKTDEPRRHEEWHRRNGT